MHGEKTKGGVIIELIKAVIIAIIVSLAGILLAALIIKLFSIKSGVIPVINQVIKGVSILVGCLIAFKTKHNSWLKGLVVGLVYVVLAFVIFSLLAGGFKWGINLLNDITLSAVSGLASGIIASFKK